MIVATENSYLLSCWDSKTAIFKPTYCQVNNNNVIADINRNHMLRVVLFFITSYLVVFRIQNSWKILQTYTTKDLEEEKKSSNVFETLFKYL